MRILVTGATGYIGGRLVPRLLAAGHDVRCLARSPENLSLQPWRDKVEVVAGDVFDIASVKEAAAGCDAAFYLVHSMAGGKGFEERDRTAASNFSKAAADAGLEASSTWEGSAIPGPTTPVIWRAAMRSDESWRPVRRRSQNSVRRW